MATRCPSGFARPAFSGELSVVRAPQVANHGAYVLAALLSARLTPLVSMMGLMLCVVLLCVAFTLWQKRGYAPGLLGFVGLTLLWVLFYLSNSLLLWEVFSYSPVFSAANDTKFYITDSFLPLVSFAALINIFSLEVRGMAPFRHWGYGAFGGLFSRLFEICRHPSAPVF